MLFAATARGDSNIPPAPTSNAMRYQAGTIQTGKAATTRSRTKAVLPALVRGSQTR
jgi:hypothetical protein